MSAGGGAATASPTHVVVGLPTYRRVELLVELLPLVVQQLRDGQAAGEVGRGAIVVVDNDAQCSARDAVAALELPEVHYVADSVPAIAGVRNRVLEEALALNADVVAFIDDDEHPFPGWLSGLLRTWHATGASAVIGQIFPSYAVQPSEWILAGEFFERRWLPTGTPVQEAPTANLLVDLDFVRRTGLRFDLRTGLSGGEDSLFTRSINAHGGTVVFTCESAVDDRVPEARLTRRWVLARALSHGNTTALLDTGFPDEQPTLPGRLRAAGRGLGRMGFGAGRLAYGYARRDLVHQARGARLVARGFGMTVGAAGLVYHEYGRGGARFARVSRELARS